MNPAPLDGNVAAGDLADVFAFDVTVAVTTCSTCHHAHPMAALRAYVQAPGLVLRCSRATPYKRGWCGRRTTCGSTCAASTCSRSRCPASLVRRDGRPGKFSARL